MGKWDVTSMHKEIDMSITDKQLTDIQARIDAATHEFLPVNGHPDDDECTNRADGTDDTYCGEPEAAHDVIPDEFSLDPSDLLDTDAAMERMARAAFKARYGTESLTWAKAGLFRESYRKDARAALDALLGGQDA